MASETNEMQPILSQKAKGGESSLDGQEGSSESRRFASLSIPKAALFVVGDVVGLGVLVLPAATNSVGWITAVIMPLVAILMAYTGVALTTSWQILQDRYPESYQMKNVRNPYAVIGFEAFGNIGRIISVISLHAMIVFTALAFLLLMAGNVTLLIQFTGVNFSICYVLPVLFVLVTPFTWFGSPSDSWGIAAFASLSSLVAVICLIIQMCLDYATIQEKQVAVSESSKDLNAVFLGISIMVLSFVGHINFLNVQNDMKEPSRVSESILLGFFVILLMYLPVALGCYFVYGDTIQTNVLDGLPFTFFTTVVNIMMTSHLFCAFTIFTNPFMLEMEELLGLEDKFYWKRVFLRSFLVLVIVFIGETVPNVSSVLHILSSAVQPLACVILPCLFKLRIDNMYQEGSSWKMDRVILYLILVCGIIATLVCTYYAVSAFVFQLRLPCYLNMSYTP